MGDAAALEPASACATTFAWQTFADHSMSPTENASSKGGGSSRRGGREEKEVVKLIGSGDNVYILYPSRKLGKGSFASVIRGVHKLSKRPVAVKVISTRRLNAKLQENLNVEINLLKQLDHVNIVKLFDVDHLVSANGDRFVCMVMEYCGGGDLSRLLRKEGRLPELDALGYMQQLAAGLEFLHQHSVVHRDLKPQNLLLSKPDEHGYQVLKIADFGFARFMTEDLAQTICGSPLYMAPEVSTSMRGSVRGYDAKADLWSVGVILYELLYGKTPFTGTSHQHLLENIKNLRVQFPADVPVSEEAKNLLLGLLQKDPNVRMDWDMFFQHPWLAMKSPSTPSSVHASQEGAHLEADGSGHDGASSSNMNGDGCNQPKNSDQVSVEGASGAAETAVTGEATNAQGTTCVPSDMDDTDTSMGDTETSGTTSSGSDESAVKFVADSSRTSGLYAVSSGEKLGTMVKPVGTHEYYESVLKCVEILTVYASYVNNGKTGRHAAVSLLCRALDLIHEALETMERLQPSAEYIEHKEEVERIERDLLLNMKSVLQVLHIMEDNVRRGDTEDSAERAQSQEDESKDHEQEQDLKRSDHSTHSTASTKEKEERERRRRLSAFSNATVEPAEILLYEHALDLAKKAAVDEMMNDISVVQHRCSDAVQVLAVLRFLLEHPSPASNPPLTPKREGERDPAEVASEMLESDKRAVEALYDRFLNALRRMPPVSN